MTDSGNAPAPRPAPSDAEEHAVYHRSAKNYLIDRPFQLKYTGYLVFVAVFFSLALGILLYRTSAQLIEQSRRVVEQGRETVKQSQETVARGRDVIEQSRKVSQVVAMNIAKEYKDDPELAKTFKIESDKDEAHLRAEQQSLENDARYLRERDAELGQQAKDVASQQRGLLMGLLAALALLVVGIGAAGIVITHKIAGPIFKMRRLLREVGQGKLVLREKLRKGDELQSLFESFEGMVTSLNSRQAHRLEGLTKLVAALEAEPQSADGRLTLSTEQLAELKRVEADMRAQIEA